MEVNTELYNPIKLVIELGHFFAAMSTGSCPQIPASNACASYHTNFLLLTLQNSSVLLDFIQRIANCFDNRIIGSNTQQAWDLHLYLTVF